MNIGMVGLGKLGLPVAIVMSSAHRVRGYDLNPLLMKKRQYEHEEDKLQPLFDNSSITFDSLKDTVENSDIVFIAVQTPHEPLYEGITRLPSTREDFDYTHLIKSVEEVAEYVRPEQIVVVISTVLPGTMDKHILPILKNKAKFVYNPLFIAMGTVVYDFINPEFVLLGSNDEDAIEKVAKFYFDIKTRQDELIGMPATSYNHFRYYKIAAMSIESAELTKVAYNTFISMKIAYANTLMEICHKTPGCNLSEVTAALSKANVRLLSSKYLQGGMGDGGACHPRDNIAMSSLAKRLDLSYDMFENMMICRERQTEWLVNLMLEHDLPKVILGKAFKPETKITAGSPATLCANLLQERNIEFIHHDYITDGHREFTPSVFLIATKHDAYSRWKFPVGSVVIDPHRYVKKQDGVKLISVGINQQSVV